MSFFPLHIDIYIVHHYPYNFVLGNFTCAECKGNLIFNTKEMLEMHMSAYHPGVG